MKVAVVVQGRFHALELMQGLIAAGHDATLFINYPALALERMGLPAKYVRSFTLHGVLSRVLRGQKYEPFLSKLFGWWAARAVRKERWDLIHVFSTAAEEMLRARPGRGEVIDVMRGCSHIRTQDQLVTDEAARVGAPMGRPYEWTMQREEREYALADRVVALSRFAWQSFIDQGSPKEKVLCLPLAAELPLFAGAPADIAARAARIRAGGKLRLLFVGSVSYRKGAYDLLAMTRALDPQKFEWRIVGDISVSQEHLAQLRERAEIPGRLPYSTLAATFAWGDVFVFPTIEDGFAVVLAQALAAGLPVLTTPNSGGPDLVTEGGNGWILPIRAPQDFISKIQALEQDREGLAAMAANLTVNYPSRTWAQVVDELVAGIGK